MITHLDAVSSYLVCELLDTDSAWRLNSAADITPTIEISHSLLPISILLAHPSTLISLGLDAGGCHVILRASGHCSW